MSWNLIGFFTPSSLQTAFCHGVKCAPGQVLELLKEDILWELKLLWLGCWPTKGASQ